MNFTEDTIQDMSLETMAATNLSKSTVFVKPNQLNIDEGIKSTDIY